MKIIKIFYIQMFICLLIFLAFTSLRMFDVKGFDEFSEIYSFYAYFDTNVSLVYEGR